MVFLVREIERQRKRSIVGVEWVREREMEIARIVATFLIFSS